MPIAPAARTLTRYALWYGLSGLFLAVSLTPITGGLPNPIVHSSRALDLMRLALLCLTPLGAWLALTTPRLGSTERRLAWALCLMAAGLCEIVHYWAIDKGHYFPVSMFADNTTWQRWMHRGILALDPGYLPHSYRFLPDAIVEVFVWLCGDFEFARLAYRLLFDALLFAVVYRYARLYVTALSSAAVVLLIVMVYPVTILRYAGQFVDPASHLSFAVCLYSLAAGYEPAFGPSLFLGIFAKESVVVMGLCRVFYGASRLRALGATALYFGVGVAIAAGIRLVVNHGTFNYGKVSGVQWDHIQTNLSLYNQWGPLYLLSLGVFIPGAVLGWRYMDSAFKATALLVTAAVIVSSLIFSWLAEVRNLVPAFFPLAVASLKYVEVRLFGIGPGQGTIAAAPVTTRGRPHSAQS